MANRETSEERRVVLGQKTDDIILKSAIYLRQLQISVGCIAFPKSHFPRRFVMTASFL